MAFDPYLEWLGIPAQRRPPSHHDLLGLPPGPVDPARLEAAILERMTVVRKFHAGARSDDAVRLCEELTQAYNCLKDGKSPVAPAAGAEKSDDDVPVRQSTDDGLLDDDFDDDDLDEQIIRLDDFDDDLEPIDPIPPAPVSAVAEVLFRSDDPAPRRSWFVAMAVGSLALVLFVIAGTFLWWRGADQPTALAKLAPIEDGSIVVGDSMTLRVQADSDGMDASELAYRLGSDAPEGAELDPITGEFTWKPRDESAVGVHRVAVQIGPVDSDEVFDEASFQVVVRPAPKPEPPPVKPPEPVKPSPPVAPQIADGPDYEREAAEWLLAVGGQVTIRDESVRMIQVASDAKLPSSRFDVMSFQLPDASTKQKWLPGLYRLARLSERPPIWATVIPGLADADIKHFQTWKWVESMRLDGPQLTDGAIENLIALRGLKWLRLENTSITEDGRRRLEAALPNCVVFMNPHPRTRRAPVSSEAEAHREAAKWVIEQGGEVGVIVPGKPEAICTLVDQLPWQGFWVNSFSVSDRLAPLESAELERFVELATVAQAKLDVASLGESSMSKLRRMTDLQFLTIHRARVADLGFEQLAQCKRLTRLFTSDAKITDANLSRIGRIHSLQELSLTDSPVTDLGLQHLKALPRLRLLDLTGTHVSDMGLSSLADLPSLAIVGLTRCAVTDAGLPRLSGVTWLSSLWLNETRITDAGMASVQSWPLLGALHLGYTTVGDQGIRELETTGIRQLYLPGTNASDSGIAHLANMTDLTTLDASETLVTPVGLRSLSRLPRLTNLSASITNSSDASIAALRALTGLKRLELVNFVSDAQTLARVQASLPDCRVDRVSAKPRQSTTGGPGAITDGAPMKTRMPTRLLVGERPPNLGDRAPLHFDDGLGTNPAFTGRESSVGQSGYRSGKLFIRKKPQFSQASEQAKWGDEFAAIEVAGRVVGGTGNSWDVTISNPDWSFSLKFSLGSEGCLRVKAQEAVKRGAAPTLQPATGFSMNFPTKDSADTYSFTSSAIKSVESWNRLLVVISRDDLVAFVNGVAVCPPCSMSRIIPEPTRSIFRLDFGPMDSEPAAGTSRTFENYLASPRKVVLSVTGRGEATAEFDEIKVWSAADLLAP